MKTIALLLAVCGFHQAFAQTVSLDEAYKRLQERQTARTADGQPLPATRPASPAAQPATQPAVQWIVVDGAPDAVKTLVEMQPTLHDRDKARQIGELQHAIDELQTQIANAQLSQINSVPSGVDAFGHQHYAPDQKQAMQKERTIADLRQQIGKAKRAMREFQYVDPGFIVPEVDLEVGQIGKCNCNLHIIQVLGDKSMIAEMHGETVVFKGLPTTGMVDDSDYEFSGVVMVAGTTRYTTALGGAATHFCLEPFDIDRWISR